MRFYDFYLKLRNLHENSNNSQLLSELTSDLAKELEDWRRKNSEDLPFHSLFKGENKTRIVIPFNTDPIAVDILNKYQKYGMTPDWNNGTLINSAGRVIRLNRWSLNPKSPLTPAEKRWLETRGEAIKELERASKIQDYVIVVSRNPIDIARMSDHDGWTSCHGPSKEFFHCAVSDSKGAGAIAYVVNKNDLQKVDLEQPEIFQDKQRKIDGIKPISRIRLRKFVHKDDDYDLAVPEDKIYGIEIPGLKNSVRDWALKNQQDKLKGKRPSMDEFQLMGGSYQDTKGGHLFNLMFGDDKDRGESHYGGKETHLNMFDQYEDEIKRINRRYQNQWTICTPYATVEQEGDEPYVAMYAVVKIALPTNLFIANKINQEVVRSKILNWGNENQIYPSDITFEKDGIAFYVDNDNFDNDPDGYENFLNEVLKPIEQDKLKLQNGLYKFLIDLNVIHGNKALEITNNLEQYKKKFEHLSLRYLDWIPQLEISLKTPIDIPSLKNVTFDIASEKPYLHSNWQKQFNTEILKELNNWAVLSGYGKVLSEFKIPPKFTFSVKDDDPITKPQQINFKLVIETVAHDTHVENVMNFLVFMDQNYNKFVQIVTAVYKKIFSN